MAGYEKYITPDMMNLTDTYAVKILICYFLRQINRPITPMQLTEIATDDGIVNYFVFTEAVNELLEAKTLTLEEQDGEQYYVLSELAKIGANDFKRMVPNSFRNKILSSGLKFFARLKNQNDVKISVSEQEKGCSVNILCTEGGLTLMDLRLYAPDREQAQLLADKIMLNPADFYGKVLDYALENEEYEPEAKEVNDL